MKFKMVHEIQRMQSASGLNWKGERKPPQGGGSLWREKPQGTGDTDALDPDRPQPQHKLEKNPRNPEASDLTPRDISHRI